MAKEKEYFPENKKDLSHEEKIVQTSTQGLYTPFPISTQFLALQASHPKSNLKSKDCQVAIKKLNKIKTEKIDAPDFLIKLKQAFNIKELGDSNYISHKIGQTDYILRISNHSVNTYYANTKTIETSLVIKLSEHDFVDHKDRLVKEFVYYPENLTKEIRDNIIKGLTDWVNTGNYSYEHADKINISSDLQQQLSAQSNEKRNVALEEAPTQGDKSMPGEQKDLYISEEQALRIQLAREIKQNMPNLTDGERAAAIAILEAGAASQKMSLTDYVQQTFPNGVFGDYEKAQNAAHQQGVEINGAVSVSGFGANARAVIYASKTADFSTWCHELSHIWQAQLTGELKNNAEKAFQVQNGNWQESTYTFADGHTDTSAEAFAYGFEDFLKKKAGEMAAEDKKAIFEKFADYMSRTYNGVKENIKVNEDIAKVYEQFVQLDGNILAEAEKAVRMEIEATGTFDKMNSIFFEPDTGDTEEKSNSILNGEPVYSVNTADFVINAGEKYKLAARRYIQEHPQGTAHTNIGDIDINQSSLDHSFEHSTYKDKIHVIPALKNVLESGTYLGVMKDADGKRINNHYFAAPVKIDEETKIVFIRVREAAGDKSRFYIHDVFTSDEIEKVNSYSGTPVTLRAKTGADLYKSIIQDYEKNNIIQNNPLLFQAAYHGSGASFEHFNTARYGLSGEGSMSFGYGTYVTDDEEIARDYAERQSFEKDSYKLKSEFKDWDSIVYDILALDKAVKKGEDFAQTKEQILRNLKNDLESKKSSGYPERIITWAENDVKNFESLNSLSDIDNIFENRGRHLYSVEIPDGKFLEWDKTVPGKIRSEISEKLNAHIVESDPESYSGNAAKYLQNELASLFESEMDGQHLYGTLADYLGSEKQASEFLKDFGYTGISYPAGTIYGNGNGATNYVIFNDDDIEIKEHLQFQLVGEPSIMRMAETQQSQKSINTQGEKNMAQEKQIIAEIGFADGEIKQYDDAREFLNDLDAASKENVHDTSFRVYTESDELKRKASDVKIDNYDPIEAAERMYNGYEWNDVEHEAVQFTQSAEGRRLLKDAENGRLTILDARDILDAVEKNGMTLRYDPLPNSYVVDGWTAADGEKLDNYMVSMSELKRLAGIEISENSQQNQIQEKKTARTPEEEQAYQEWLEMLEDNQQAEDRMERMQGIPPEERPVIESLYEIGNAMQKNSTMVLKSPTFGDVTFSNGVFGDLSKKNNGGYGINHIVEGRYVKDGLSNQDIASLLYLVKDTVETTKVEIDESKSRQNIVKDGIWVTLRKDFDGVKQNWVVTGFAENDGNGQMTKEAADAIKAVNARYGYAPEHLFVSEQVGAAIASVNTIAQNILKSSDKERIENFKSVYANTKFLEENLAMVQETIPQSAPLPEWQQRLNATINQAAEMDGVKNSIKAALYDNAEKFTDVPFSREGYERLFQDGVVQSPLETIHFADNQFDVKDQEKFMLAAYQTLSNPDLIYAESENQDNLESRNYVKTFIFGEDEKSALDIVVKTIDGQKVMISAKKRSLEDLIDRIKQPDQLVYMSEEIKQAIDRRSPEEKQRLKDVLPKLRIVPENTAYDKEKAIATARNFAAEKRNVALEKKSIDERFDILISYEDKFIKTEKENLPSEITQQIKDVERQIEEYWYDGTIPKNARFTLPTTQTLAKQLGCNTAEISIPVAVIKKARDVHNFSALDIKKSLTQLYNPVIVFDSDKSKSESKADSRLILTDSFKYEYDDNKAVRDVKPIAFAVNVDSTVDLNNRGLTIEVQDVRSIHDRTLVAKNGTDLIQEWTKKGLCRSIDDKKIGEWSTVAGIYFPLELLNSPKNNILTKTEIVNSLGKDFRNPATKEISDWSTDAGIYFPIEALQSPKNNILTKTEIVNSFESEKRNVALETKPELSFPDQVDAVLAGKNDRFNALKVCDTPELLLQAGLKQLPMLYTARHLREAIQPKDLHNHTHGIKVEQIKALPKLLEEPVMIYDSLSRPDSIIVLTSEFDEDKMPIVVSIRPDGKGTYSLEKVDSNFVTSVYGRENFEKHINSVIDNRNLLYWNKGKSQVLFSVLGQQLPKGLNNLDPNRILHQTNSVVNTKSISTQEEKTMERENEKPTQKQELSQDKDVQENNIQKAVSRAKIQHDEVNVYGTPSGTVTLDFTGNPDAFQQITGTDTAPYMNNSEGKPFRAEISMRIQDDGNIHAEVILPSLINDTTKNYRLEELLKANSREFSGDLKAALKEKFREQTGITADLFTGTEKRNVALEAEQKPEHNSSSREREAYDRKYPTDWQIYTKELTDKLNAVSLQIENYLKYGTLPENSRFILPNSPQFLQKIGSHDTQISLPIAVVKKAHETHGLTLTEIQDAVKKLYNPVLAFDSDKSKSENKADSRLLLTDSFTKENKPVALAINVNSNVKLIDSNISAEVQDIRSIHDRTLIAKNGTDLIKKWTQDGLCRYVDDKKISDWSSLARVYFPIELLQSPKNNILTKTEIVNSFESEKRNVALEDEKIQKENAPQPSLAQDIIERERRKEKWRASHGKALPTDKKDLATEQKKPESKQHSPQKSSAKDYIRRVSEQFLKDIEQGSVPFMRGEEVGDSILIKVKAVRNAVTGRALTGFQQLLAQDMINKLVEKGVLKRMEHELVTYEQAKECGTFIKKGSPHIILPVYNEKTNEASLQMYYFKSGCKEPEKIELANDKVRREAYIKRLRVRLSTAEKERMLTQNEKDELYNMIANAHQAILVYMEAMHQNVSVYRSSLPKHEQEALRKVEELEKNKEKKTREESLQELIKESMERRHRMEDEEARRQEEKPIYFDARKTASYESYLGTVMAAATVDGNVVASKDVIATVVQTLTPVMRQAFNQFDYMKGFDIGKIMNSKCKENLRDYRRNSIDNLQKSQAMEKVLAFRQGGQMNPPDRNAVEVETYSM